MMSKERTMICLLKNCLFSPLENNIDTFKAIKNMYTVRHFCHRNLSTFARHAWCGFDRDMDHLRQLDKIV